jgi:hypothetical protein
MEIIMQPRIMVKIAKKSLVEGAITAQQQLPAVPANRYRLTGLCTVHPDRMDRRPAACTPQSPAVLRFNLHNPHDLPTPPSLISNISQPFKKRINTEQLFYYHTTKKSPYKGFQHIL